ncbi:MAG: DUF3303 family protein [Alphaproteobacteria bacterium]
MLYILIEHFKDAAAVYRRFEERGRMLPEGLTFHEGWVEAGHDRCFQTMSCEDPALLATWADNWRDLADFEFIPVTTSQAARDHFK